MLNLRPRLKLRLNSDLSLSTDLRNVGDGGAWPRDHEAFLVLSPNYNHN